jgi:quinol monooxygenase YgiN
MIVVLGSVIAQSGQEDAVRDLSRTHVQRSRADAGCIAHNVSVDSENASRFVFVEYWQDMPALITHFALQDSQDFVRDLQPLLSEKPEMRIFDADEIQR